MKSSFLIAALFTFECWGFTRPPTIRRKEQLVPQPKSLSPGYKPTVMVIGGRSVVGPLQDTKAPPLLVKLAASPVGAILVLFGIVIFHETGHYLTGRFFGLRADEFSIGFGPKLLGFEAFGDEFSLRALPMGGYVKFPELSLPWQQRVLISSSGIFFNLLFAFVIYLVQTSVGAGLPRLVYDEGVVVSAIAGPDAAASGILVPGDVIVGVNDAPITMPSPSRAGAQRAITRIIETIQATTEGESLELSIIRKNKSQAVSITPKRVPSQVVGLPPGPPTIGVFLEPNVVEIRLLKSDSIIEATGMAADYVVTLTKETATGLLTFVGDLFSGKAGTSEYRVSGPVGVVKTASKVVATQDWNTVLEYAAALSINLGVINAFPIPPLDGFYIAIALTEALWSQTLS